MTHGDCAGDIRRVMIAAMGAQARQPAQVLRPDDDPFAPATPSLLGSLQGYRYTRRSRGAPSVGLPAALADADATEWYMDLSAGYPVTVAVGDLLRFDGGDERRVARVNGSGGAYTNRDVYRLYLLVRV